MDRDLLRVQSYSDYAISLAYFLENIPIGDSSYYAIPDSLIIERKLEQDSVYSVLFTGAVNYSIDTTFIDSMVNDTGIYHYLLATKNQYGRSVFDSVSWHHQLPVDTIKMVERTCDYVKI